MPGVVIGSALRSEVVPAAGEVLRGRAFGVAPVSRGLRVSVLSLGIAGEVGGVAGPGSTTLPMEIFSKVRLGVSPDINALATIIIGIVALGVGIATVLQLRRPKAARL